MPLAYFLLPISYIDTDIDNTNRHSMYSTAQYVQHVKIVWYVQYVPYVRYVLILCVWEIPPPRCTDLFRKLSCTNMNLISYIQDGNIPIRDSSHPTPPHAGAVRGGAGAAWGGVGWEGIPYGYIPILDIGYLIFSLYIHKHIFEEHIKAVKETDIKQLCL